MDLYLLYDWRTSEVLYKSYDEEGAYAYLGKLCYEDGSYDEDIHLIKVEINPNELTEKI